MKKKPEEMDENEILYKLLQDKVGCITPTDVFSYKEGTSSDGQRIVNYSLGGKKMQQNQANTLRSEAKLVQNSQLFVLFTDTMTRLAHDFMFTKMKTLEDQHYGKAILTATDIFEKIVVSLAQMPTYPQATIRPQAKADYNITK